MAKSIKLRQGTETEHEAFTGQMAEVTFDTTNNRIVLHDGSTPGGIPMAKLSDVPVDLTDLTDVDDNLTGGPFSGTTYVVTVASGTNTYGTGNKYYITDETGASPTVTLTEGETYRFDQSDSTNTGHPLKFSTTANGTHDSGSEYTTGVTYNGVPGQADAYTEITVEVGAPTLYYYCQNHSGMGSVGAAPAENSLVLNSSNTVLLATATGTSDNNNITDSSTNNHSITVNGDAMAGTFSPYRSGGYSLEFNDGSNSAVGIQSSDVQIGTSAFSMEFWLYSRAHSALISSKYSPSNSNGYFVINTSTSDGLTCRTRADDSNGTQKYVHSGSGTYNLNQWNHCIFQRDANGNLTSYLNGTKYTGDNDGSTNLSATELALGVFNYIGFGTWFDGYIRDFKLTIGTSALRTDSNITVPIEPLTSDSNTTAFLGHSSYLADGSTNSNSIVSTNAIISPFSPYDYLEYAAADHGGSVYFDGTGDYLTVNDTNIANFGTNDFTIETWIYCNDTIVNTLVDTRPTNTNGAYVNLSIQAGGGVQIYSNSNYLIASPVGTINVGQWHHVACVRNSGTINIYIDGTSVGSVSNSTNFISSNFAIGWNAFLGEYTGSFKISDYRIVKGTAVYTAAFTPPTAPLSSSGSSLHIKGTDASIIDKSQSGSAIHLIGGATGSNAESKFADSYSMYFDGSDDRALVTAPSDLLDFSNGESYTLETWVNATDLSGSSWRTICNNGTSGVYGPIYLAFLGDKLHALASHNGSSYTLDTRSDIGSSGIATFVTNTWYHIAYTWDGSDYKFYVDGVLLHTITKTGAPMSPLRDLGIGARAGNYELFNGYIQDFRITKNLVRYTADFTPPTQSLGSYVVPAESAAPVENSLVLNSSNTTLLATATGTSDNNNITDSSTNNHSITVNGAAPAMAGTFSPYRSGGYSTYFDGYGDKLTLGGSALSDFNFGTNSFSIEFWMYPTGQKGPIFNTHRVGVANGYYLSTTGTNQFIFGQYVSGGADYFSTDNAYALNEWNHVSLNRDANNGNSLKLYVNGSLVLTTTNSTNYNSYTHGPYIGGYEANGPQYFFGGYISDLIVANGSVLRTGGTSLGDVAFTPPTEAFESDANTALLIGSSPYIKDSSSNSHDITVTGDVSTMPFGPYDYSEYDPSIHGGSVYFDGAGGYLTLANDASLHPGSGDFTLESWVYLNTLGTPKSIISTFNGSSTGYWDYQVKANNTPELSRDNGAIIVAGSTVLTAGQWHHLVVTRSGTTIRHFTNGVIDGTNTDSVNITSGNPTAIGSTINNVNKFSGYISDYRIVKGTAVYTAAFTPPTAPLSSSDSSLHIKGTDASIIDKSQTTNIQLFGNTTGSTTQVKFADTKSMYFDGTGDYITVDDGFHFGTGDFTFEFWLYPTENLTSGAQQFINAETSGSGVTWSFGCYPSGYHGLGYNGLTFSYGHYGSYSVGRYVNNYWPTQNTWTHLAVQRRNGIIEIFVNGTSQTLTTAGQNSTFSDGANLTSNYTSRYFFNDLEGYVQDLRITKDLGRYTANFTPPTQSLGSYVVPAESEPVTGVSPMWSLSGDSATFAAVTTAKLDTNATNYVALHHPTGWGNSWSLEDGSYVMRNNPNALNEPAPGRSVHIWSTDDLSEGMTYQYYIKFGTAQPTMWENLSVISADSSASYSYAQWLTADSNYPHTLGWGSNGVFGYYSHSANGSTRLDSQGWMHFAIELQSNGRIVHYVNGVVVLNEDASDISSLTRKANVFFGTVNSSMTDIEVYTGGGIHNPDLLATPPGFTPPARKQA